MFAERAQHSLSKSKMQRMSPSYAIFLCVTGICWEVKNCLAAEANAEPAALILASISRSSLRSLEIIDPKYLNFLTKGLVPSSIVTGVCVFIQGSWSGKEHCFGL